MEPIEVSTYETWRAMEKLVTEGLVKYVYTTNYYTLQATTAASTGDFKSFLAYKLIKYIYY